jgi:LPS-assembly lipoprotein
MPPRTPRRPLAALAVLAALLCAGCGFHLEGREQLPRTLASLRVEAGDEQTDFVHALRARLATAGARLDADAQGEGSARIHVLVDSTSERVLSVSARNVPTAYELSYRVRLSVESGGRELMAPEEHVLTREYSFDERSLLAKSREREALYQALAEDLAALYLRRFATL